jgi:hypothetical protein
VREPTTRSTAQDTFARQTNAQGTERATRKSSSWPISAALQILIGPFIALALFATLRHLHPGAILFYQGIFAATVTSLLQLLYSYWRQTAQNSTALRAALLTFFMTYSFIITVPTNADRSFSLMMLQRIAQVPSGLTKEEIQLFYTNNFVRFGGLEQRLSEQTATGTLTEHNGKYVLTRKGLFVNDTAHLTCRVFVCSGRNNTYDLPSSEHRKPQSEATR